MAYGLKVKLDKEKDAHKAEETAFTALEAKTKASEQRASDEGTATQGLRVKLEGMEADRDKCKAEMEKLTAGSLVAHALSSGDVNRVKDLLRRKNLEKPIFRAFHRQWEPSSKVKRFVK